MRIFFISLNRRAITYSLNKWLVTILVLWLGCLHAATPVSPVSPENIIRKALAERFVSGSTYFSLQEAKITPENVQVVVRDNISPSLLLSALKITGTSFQLIRSKQEAQVVIFTISYPDAKIASRMTKELNCSGSYFTNTKVLTRFSCVSVGDQFIISFTENAGDENFVNFINDFPKLFN